MGKKYFLIKAHLKELLSDTLPGKEAQYEMTALPRGHLDMPVPKHATTAAVLILLYARNDIWQTVYIQRVQHKKDLHSGQISFPGGKKEFLDKTIMDTAVRETEEEIGIPKDSVDILGLLSPFYIPISDFNVHPVIGMLDYEPSFSLQSDEVEHIIEAPLTELLNLSAKKKKNILAQNQILLKNTPYFDIRGYVIWGATAMMTNELVSLLSPISKSF